MYDIVIIGAGGFAREVHAWLPEVYSAETHRFRGFLGREPDAGAAPLLGDPLDYTPQAEDRFILAIGDLDARARLVGALSDKGATFISFIHPQSIVSASSRIGQGTVIYPYAVVSNGAKIGDFAHLSLYASAGHDADVGRNCYLSPYATLNGGSRIADNVFLGSHATVGPQVTVGRNSTVSANSCALRNVPDESFVFGVPGTAAPKLAATTEV